MTSGAVRCAAGNKTLSRFGHGCFADALRNSNSDSPGITDFELAPHDKPSSQLKRGLDNEVVALAG